MLDSPPLEGTGKQVFSIFAGSTPVFPLYLIILYADLYF